MRKLFPEVVSIPEMKIGRFDLDFIIDRIPGPIMTIDGGGEILWANRYARNLFGGELKGERIEAFFVDFEGDINPVKLAEEGVDGIMLNVNTFSNLPQTLYFSFRISGGEILIVGYRDVKEEEGIRSEIVKLNKEQANLSRELQRKNVQLNRLNDLKNQFLGMAAHDLRNPLGAILIYTEMLLDGSVGELSEEQMNFIERIRTSSELMKGMVDDFLDISVIESGKLNINRDLCDVEGIVSKSVELVRHRSRKRDIEIRTDVTKGLKFSMDCGKIGQVVTNFLTNAVGHSDEGAVIDVEAKKEGDSLVVSVKDRGSGMSPDEIEKIFEAFGKGFSAKKDGQGSIGLGLVIAKKIIEEHGGRIDVDSEPGEGSVFSFTIPPES